MLRLRQPFEQIMQRSFLRLEMSKNCRALSAEIGCDLVQCDASNPEQVKKLFSDTDKIFGTPSIVIYNPSKRIKGDIASLDPYETKLALETTCFGAFLVAQQAAIKNDTSWLWQYIFYRCLSWH